MPNFMQPDEQTTRLATVPSDLPILPLRSTLAYPFSVMPLAIGIPRSMRLIEDALQGIASSASWVSLMQKWKSLCRARCMKLAPWLISVSRTPDNTLQVVAQGIERFRIAEWIQTTPLLTGSYHPGERYCRVGCRIRSAAGHLRELAQEVVALSPHVPRELRDFLGQVHDPRLLAYMVAAIARLQVSEGQQILETDSVKDKFRRLIIRI